MNEPLRETLAFSQVCIERQPIIDRRGDTMAYELRQRVPPPMPGSEAPPLSGSAVVLAHLLGDLDEDWLPAGKRVFLQIEIGILRDPDFLALLPDARVVLDLSGAPEELDEAVLRVVDELRRRQINICLDDWRLVEGSPELLVRAEFVKLNLHEVETFMLYQRFARLKGLPLRRIARGVANTEQYRFCCDIGFDLYQGYFFTRPEIVEAREVGAGLAQLVQIFDLVGAGALPRDIEQAFKRDPTLMLKLLGYINSAGMGQTRKITSVAHAVQILGYKQLYRWVALLLYTAGGGDTPAALLTTVLTRSRLIEILGRDLMPKHEQDNLFVIGMVSLLDVVFGRPLAEALARLPLPESVLGAVIEHEGIPGLLLMLAEALEQGDFERLKGLSQTLGLDFGTINRAQLEAMRWAESIGAVE